MENNGLLYLDVCLFAGFIGKRCILSTRPHLKKINKKKYLVNYFNRKQKFSGIRRVLNNFVGYYFVYSDDILPCT